MNKKEDEMKKGLFEKHAKTYGYIKTTKKEHSKR